MYDIVIVGAGPAGSNLARLIGEKYKVLLIDKRDLDNENPNNHKSKCCGGLLAPDAQKMIAKLGLGIPKDILVNPQLFAVRTIDLTNDLERLYQRFYFNIDREKYDLLKSKLTQKGFVFENKIKTEGAYIYRPKRASQFYIGGDGIALVGEAAGAISPSSAEGISYALKSSLYLAHSLEEGIDGFMGRYKQEVRDIKLNLLLKNLKSPAMYNPFLRELAMKSGLQSIK